MCHFLPFDLKNQNFEKMKKKKKKKKKYGDIKNLKIFYKKKKPRDIIILQLCITNHNHTMYGS